MTKVTMPEHWAERIAEGTAVDFWWQNGTKGIKVGEKLITTAQAKAYADARVLEALVEVAAQVEQFHPKATPKGIAAAIRALIPKEDI